MNSHTARTGIAILVGIALVVLFASTFVVSQTQQALVLRFGAIRGVISQPGLHFKAPFVDNVIYVDKRVLDLDLPVQTLLSTDRQNLEVDAFARYRITDPLRFFQSVNNVQNADNRLGSFTNSAMRNVLAGASFSAIIRTDRDQLMNEIQAIVNRQAKNLGIEVVDLRLTRVDLPAANSQAVFQRMQSERHREAADLRAHGAQAAQGIRAKADRDVTVIVAEANQQAEQMRGQGDAEKNRVLAEAYSADPGFFRFFRSMQAYENGLKPGDTRLVLSPDSDFFRYFKGPGQAGPSTASAAPATPSPVGTGAPAPAASPANPVPAVPAPAGPASTGAVPAPNAAPAQ